MVLSCRRLVAAALLASWVGPWLAASPAAEIETPRGQRHLVTDALGRTVSFDRIPERIYVGGRAVFMLADALYAFPGARERLLGTGTIEHWQGDFLAAVDPAYARRRVTLPVSAGAEQIAALRPDAVILKTYMAETLGGPLEALGIPVVYVDFETPEQYERDLEVLGQLLSDPARAGDLRRYFRSASTRVSERTAALAEAGRPRVLVLQEAARGGEHAFDIPPAQWLQTRVVEMAGGRPVWKEANPGKGWSRVGFEQIAAWNPDWVFVVSYNEDVEAVVAALRADPDWARLAATRAGRVVAFPTDFYSWDQPDVRWVLGLQWMAARLHPELFRGYDPQRAILEFFSFLYGMDEATVRTQVFPRVRGVFGVEGGR